MTKIDFSTLAGLSFAIVLILISVTISGDIQRFFNLPSFLIVIGCTLAVSAASFSFKEVGLAFKTMLELIIVSPASSKEIAILCLQSAEFAHAEGLHEITKKPEFPLQNKLFKKWVGYAADGEKLANIDNLINQEVYSYQEQQNTLIQIFKKAGELAPAYGMIGTLVGLVQMLASIENVSAIGQGMAIALLTTFYGAITSYILLLPLATKLERNLKEDILNFRVLHRTVLSIAQRENPIQLESVVNSILPPGRKVHYFKI